MEQSPRRNLERDSLSFSDLYPLFFFLSKDLLYEYHVIYEHTNTHTTLLYLLGVLAHGNKFTGFHSRLINLAF